MINVLKKYMYVVLICLTFIFFITPLNVSATTKQDVISVARQVGMPEDLIEFYTNLGEGKEFTSAQCDMAISKLYEIYGVTNNKIEEDFNVDMDNSIQNSNTETTTPESVTSEISSTKNQDNSNFISQDEFVDMSYDEKIEYVNSLPDEEKSSFMNNLSTSSRNSIIKQLDINSKMEIANSIVQAGEAMGYNFSINEITNDKLEISMRDENGILIGITKMGVTIDETGKDYSLLIGISLCVLLSLFMVLVKISKKLKE